MAAIVVCGGSMIGLLTAAMLADDGHDVTVLESDAELPPARPADAWETWRRGVPQFRRPHNLMPRFREVSDAELPGLTDALRAAGLYEWDMLANLPPLVTDRNPRPGDDRFVYPTGRRPVVEAVVASYAQTRPRLDVRRGVKVTGLVTGSATADGVPHVTGVRCDDGTELHADLVVDASGRRTSSAEWLTAVGAKPPHMQSADCGFIYYTRYYTGPSVPAYVAPVLTPCGSFSILTIPGDNDTWSVTLFTATGDPAMKTLRDNDVFDRVLRACPLHAHWLDGTPITDVLPMAGVLDRYRRFVVDGVPVATGFAAVGDAWACTNPSAGRGLSVGSVHAQALRETVRGHLDDPLRFATSWDEMTQERVAPFYWSQIAMDRVRVAQMLAIRDGREPSPPSGDFVALQRAAMVDADVFRAALEIAACLSFPDEVMARPAVRGRMDQLPAPDGPPNIPAPRRAELVELLGA
jgi:2-polyprenyl-6-methoxyphenol hydroxylase-like FAD-dependent oxidoreductase